MKKRRASRVMNVLDTFWKVAVPVFILALFAVLLMRVSSARNSDKMQRYLALLEEGQKRGNWSFVEESLASLEEVWQQELKVIRLGARIDDIAAFQESVGKLKGFVKVQDTVGFLSTLEEMRERWKRIAKP